MGVKLSRFGSGWIFRILLGVAILILAAPSEHAQETGAKHDISWLQVAFGYSFYIFDGCGDHALGELHRKALLEKLDHCPFSNVEKERFHTWAIGETLREEEILQRYIAEHGKLPDRLEGMQGTCREHRNSAPYLKARQMLEGYGRGEISVDTVLPERCDGTAGVP